MRVAITILMLSALIYVALVPKGKQEELKAMRYEVKRATATEKKQKSNFKNLGKFKITAYCPCNQCSEGYGRETATGAMARAKHTIAVDPKVIKYGTKVKIGSRTYTAEDCGGGVKGKHIDIYFNDHDAVERYGVKYKKVRAKRWS